MYALNKSGDTLEFQVSGYSYPDIIVGHASSLTSRTHVSTDEVQGN